MVGSTPVLPCGVFQMSRCAFSLTRSRASPRPESWVPIIGDPLTVIAGVMREPIWRFLGIVTLAKTGRYLALVALTLPWT